MHYTFLSRLSLRCARYLIERYPASWRERYSEEMLLLLEDCPPTFTTVINLIFHLFDAYAHPHLLDRRLPPMLQRMRSSELAVYGSAALFWAAALFVVSTLSFVLYPFDIARDFSSFQHLDNMFTYCQLLLILLILSGGLPIFLATSWKAWKARKYHALLFLLLSLICPPIISFLASSLRDYHWWWTVFPLYVLSVAIGLTFIRMAVQNVPPSRRVTHLALYLAIPLPLVMLIVCAFILFSVLSAFTTGEITSFLMGNDSWEPGGAFIWTCFNVDCVMLLIMGATCSFSLFSLLKGFQAKKVTQDIL
jgi:MFS family permease